MDHDLVLILEYFYRTNKMAKNDHLATFSVFNDEKISDVQARFSSHFQFENLKKKKIGVIEEIHSNDIFICEMQ